MLRNLFKANLPRALLTQNNKFYVPFSSSFSTARRTSTGQEDKESEGRGLGNRDDEVEGRKKMGSQQDIPKENMKSKDDVAEHNESAGGAHTYQKSSQSSSASGKEKGSTEAKKGKESKKDKDKSKGTRYDQHLMDEGGI